MKMSRKARTPRYVRYGVCVCTCRIFCVYCDIFRPLQPWNPPTFIPCTRGQSEALNLDLRFVFFALFLSEDQSSTTLSSSQWCNSFCWSRLAAFLFFFFPIKQKAFVCFLSSSVPPSRPRPAPAYRTCFTRRRMPWSGSAETTPPTARALSRSTSKQLATPD